MRPLRAMGVLCFAAAPVIGDEIALTFDIISGSLTMDVSPDGWATPDSVSGAMDGTFGVAIYASDGHIGESDTFVLTQSAMTNTEALDLTILGLMTANIYPGSAVFMDFAPVAPGHLGAGGAGTISTDVYAEILVSITGLASTPLESNTWAGEPLDFDVIITTSARMSDTVAVNLHGTFGVKIWSTGAEATFTLDLIIDVTGTAHYPPEPALSGLCALGIAGAGSWLRRRRQLR